MKHIKKSITHTHIYTHTHLCAHAHAGCMTVNLTFNPVTLWTINANIYNKNRKFGDLPTTLSYSH